MEGIEKIEFYTYNERIATVYEQPYTLVWKDFGFRIYSVKAIANDSGGTSIYYEIMVLKLL